MLQPSNTCFLSEQVKASLACTGHTETVSTPSPTRLQALFNANLSWCRLPF